MAGGSGAHVTRLGASLNLQALSLAEGVRAALSVAVIIALIEYFQWPPLIEAALAALNTCMCDPGGPIRRRVPVLLAYTLLSALVVAGFTVARGWGIAVALPLGVFGLFCATFVRIYGETPQLVGVLLGVMIIMSLDRGGRPHAGRLARAALHRWRAVGNGADDGDLAHLSGSARASGAGRRVSRLVGGRR